MFPLWDPGQLLNTSQLLLLKAATSQAVDEGSDSDSISVTSEGDYGPKYVDLHVLLGASWDSRFGIDIEGYNL